MATAKGIFRQLRIAEETAYGVLPAANTGTMLRRVSGAMQFNKDIYQSQELRPSQMLATSRHGVHRVQGSIGGELSPGAARLFIEGLLRRNLTVTQTTGTLSTVAVAAGPPATFTRTDAGSFLTDGFKVGDVIRWQGWTAPAIANNNRFARIIDISADGKVITVPGTGNEAFVTKAAGDPVSVRTVGRKTWLPETGQVLKSYAIEQWSPDADTPISERFVGVRPVGLRLNLPPTGFVTYEVQLLGQTMSSAATEYFTNPAAAPSFSALAAVSGVVRFNGADVATITGGQIAIQSQVDGMPVCGSDIIPEIAPMTLTTTGQVSMLVRDQAVHDLFRSEAEVDLHWWLTSDRTINAPFMAITLSRVKLNGAAKSDSPGQLIQSVPFESLEHVAGGTGTKFERTIVSIQDSSIP